MMRQANRWGRCLGVVFLGLLVAAVAGCRSAPPVSNTDPDIATAATAARRAFDHGKIPQAVVLYERALTRARAVDAADEIANNAYNLALCLVAQGQLDRAEGYLVEASHGAGRAGIPVADILLLQARVAQLAGRGPDASARLKQARAQMDLEADRLQADVLEAELAMAGGEWERVHGLVDELQHALRRGKHPVLLRAQVAGLSGLLAMEQGNPGAAAAAFDRQATHLRQAGQPHDMAMALGAAASQYAAAEDWPATWDRAYRAGRSLLAQGQPRAARHQVPLAAKAVEALDDPDARALTAALFEAVQAALDEKETDSHE